MSDIETTVRYGTELFTDPAWDAFVARAGTVFHTSRFLLSWWVDRTAKHPASRLVTTRFADGPDLVGGCAFEVQGDLLAFAGGRNVVDYLGPVAVSGQEKEVAAALTRFVFDDLAWREASFGGLAADDVMAQEFIDAVTREAPGAQVEVYDKAPKINETSRGYLPLLNAKRRGEILRKRNRLTEAVGELDLVTSTESTWVDALRRLLAWKSTVPAVRDFVSEYGDFLRGMLAALVPAQEAHIVELCAGDRRLASAIVLSHRRTKYLYNMSYDHALAGDASTALAPGVVLVSLLAEQALELGWRFDFLKGAQDYKLRLGGVPEDMIVVTVRR